MDPDAALARIRELGDQVIDDQLSDEERVYAGISLVEAIDALDGWCKQGGFLPSEWAASLAPVGRVD